MRRVALFSLSCSRGFNSLAIYPRLAWPLETCRDALSALIEPAKAVA